LRCKPPWRSSAFFWVSSRRAPAWTGGGSREPSAPGQLAFHAPCHFAGEQAFAENPGPKCRSGKPRTDRKMGQIARGALTAWDGGDRAFSLGFARISGAFAWLRSIRGGHPKVISTGT